MRKNLLAAAILIMVILSGCSKSEKYPEALQEAVDEASAGSEILAATQITSTTVYRFQLPSPTHSGITMYSSTSEVNHTPVVYTIWCSIYKTSSSDVLPIVFIENDLTAFTHVLEGTKESNVNAHEYYLWKLEDMMKAYDGCYDVWNLVDSEDWGD